MTIRKSVSMSRALYEQLRKRAAEGKTSSRELVHRLVSAGLGVDVPHYKPGEHPASLTARQGPEMTAWRKRRKADPDSVESRPPPGAACTWCEQPFHPRATGDRMRVGDEHVGCNRQRTRVESRTAQRRMG